MDEMGPLSVLSYPGWRLVQAREGDLAGRARWELGRLMFLSKGAVTQLADRLERLGYLERRPNPEDRRSLILVETKACEEAALK